MRKFLFSVGISWIALWLVRAVVYGDTAATYIADVTFIFVPAIAAFLIGLLFDE